MPSALLRPDWLLVIVGIFTGLVVGWQAWETRRGVQSARDQARISGRSLIAQLRPKVHIRTIRVIEEDDSLSLEVTVVNTGGTAGQISEGHIALDWIWAHSKKSPVATASFEPSTLEPGEQRPLKITLSGNWVMYKFSVDPEYSSGMRLRCEGTILYADDNGVVRRTAFSRLRNASTEKWEIDPNPEFEYAD